MQPNQESTIKVEQRNSGNNRLLLVDDEPDIIFTFKKKLEANGFVADAFNDPVFALSNFKPGIYGVCLMLRCHRSTDLNYKKIKKIDIEVKA